MIIDEQLYLTSAIDRPDGTTIYIHAAPLGRDAFDRYWKPLSRVYDEIMLERRFYSAPKVAARMLRDIATQMGVWDGPQGVAAGLMAELRRLTSVIAPGDQPNGQWQGWQLVPLADALREGMLHRDDVDAVENLLTFFSAVWHVAPRSQRTEFVTTGVALSGAQILSLPLSEFVASLPTSTQTVPTGETPPAPSLPLSSTGQPATVLRPSSTTAQMTSPGAPPQSFAIAS